MSLHSQAHATCAYCPKACHFACPISGASGEESLSTWGKMTAAFLAERRGGPPDAETALAVHACTGCQRCTAFCKHENEVGAALFAARTATIAAGTQPAGAASTLATFSQAQNPFGVELGALAARFRPAAPVRFALFPGCTALAREPGLVEDAVLVSAAFGAPMGVSPVAGRCCGYPLHAAGAHEAFRAHAAGVAEALAGTPELVVLDPGCAFTFLRLYPEAGVSLATRVRTVVEVLAENLPHAPARPPLDEVVGYHDACHLGRGLGQYEAPRALARRAARQVLEADSSGREAGCSGGGGLLPRTAPALAAEVARRQGVEVARGSAAATVTACPTSKRMFERSGRTSYHLVSLLRRWLERP